MPETKNKKMIIKGAGKFMAKLPNCDEIVTLGYLNNMKLDIQLDMQDVEGGDSSVPLDTLLRKKTIDITAEDAKFDLNMVRLVLGSKLKEGVTGATYEYQSVVVILNAPTTPDGSLYAPLPTAPLASPATKVFDSNGKPLDSSVVAVNGANLKVPSTTGLDGMEVTVMFPVAVDQSRIDSDGYVWVLEEKHTVKGGQIQLGFGETLYTEADGSKTSHISIRGLKTNKLMKKTAGLPSATEYTIDDQGKAVFHPDMENVDVYVNYKRNEVVDVLAIATKDFPLTVMVVHDGAYEQKDGTIQAFQTELYACRVKSNFQLDAQRQQASTHSVTLTVIDPERADNKLGTIKRYEVVNTANDAC